MTLCLFDDNKLLLNNKSDTCMEEKRLWNNLLSFKPASLALFKTFFVKPCHVTVSVKVLD